ncbi:MAG: hypothetical protein PHG69_00935 [Candidatus Omnitrophica bacterium]|nr:hypothetical protein [Candidatus Omnitrophota bacterium]
MKGKIEKFMDNDFGLGGACNYERSSINDGLKVLTSFYSVNLGDAERVSLLNVLNRWERDDFNYRKRIETLQDEAEQLKEIV